MVSLTPRQWWWLALAATLAFRFWLGAALPITADEAYFTLWGRYPALGYYDHPPMVGWLLAPLVAVSQAEWVVRLPSILLPAALALLVRQALAAGFARDADTADLAALAVLLVPMNVWNVFITTDTPLAFFAVASLLAFARQRSSPSTSPCCSAWATWRGRSPRAAPAPSASRFSARCRRDCSTCTGTGRRAGAT